eukprot:comp20535_c1_seq2/m.26328 comp20535_c1_seq2/g.26328  ORF comp20535_c1_seq2/g.26328 comp20535_c1_seq2/m.26328 type:complete len:137 (-) comp20535_c1_seq2:267-677(-)
MTPGLISPPCRAHATEMDHRFRAYSRAGPTRNLPRGWEGLSPRMRHLLGNMLAVDPEARWTMDRVRSYLGTDRSEQQDDSAGVQSAAAAAQIPQISQISAGQRIFNRQMSGCHQDKDQEGGLPSVQSWKQHESVAA